MRINPDAAEADDVIALRLPALQALTQIQDALGVIVGRRNTGRRPGA